MNDMAILITRDITCLYCGHKGLMDIHDEGDDVAYGCLFLHLGHNPSSGDLHYRCPACGIVLLVDPMLALGEKPIRGVPQQQTVKKKAWVEGVLNGFINGFLDRTFPNESEEHRLS